MVVPYAVISGVIAASFPLSSLFFSTVLSVLLPFVSLRCYNFALHRRGYVCIKDTHGSRNLVSVALRSVYIMGPGIWFTVNNVVRIKRCYYDS